MRSRTRRAELQMDGGMASMCWTGFGLRDMNKRNILTAGITARFGAVFSTPLTGGSFCNGSCQSFINHLNFGRFFNFRQYEIIIDNSSGKWDRRCYALCDAISGL